MNARRIPAIEKLATAVYDNGRRGSPIPGCDCLQCFGYCMVDPGSAARERFGRRPENVGLPAGTGFYHGDIAGGARGDE